MVYRSKINKLLADYAHAKRQVADERKALTKAEQRELDVARAQSLVQSVAENVQNLVHSQVASVVTRCLQSVFEEEAYEFKIAFEQKRNKTEARLLFSRDNMDFDPTSSTGGGAVDVASFGLRAVCLMLSRPVLRRLLVLDEPFSKLRGERYQENVNQLLPMLAKELDLQIIMVADQWLQTEGKQIEL